MGQDLSANFSTFNQDTGYTFEDADASNGVMIDLMLTQEDFDTATSVGPDVVEKTDANLGPHAHGRGRAARARTGSKNKQTKINPFLLSARYQINNPRVRTRFKERIISGKYN